MNEVEIKLQLESRRRAALLRAPALRRARPERLALLALYFDTPDGDLARHEMALRLRREEGRWMQTLKAGRGGAGGLHARGEWEFATEGPVLDLARFHDTPLADLAHASHLHETLVEAFRVDVRRTRWTIGRGASRVEVVLDQGEVRREADRTPILEVEIESKGSDPHALFDLAQRLVEHVPMRPSPVTKARRGHRLLHHERLAPVHARHAALDASASPAAAARATVAEALQQLQANEEGVLETADPEFVHQFRVALRRLRSALRSHRRALEPGFEESVTPELRWITGVAGEARDMDVFADTTLPAMAGTDSFFDRKPPAEKRVCPRYTGEGAFVARLERRRARAHVKLRASLRSSRYGLLLLALSRWLHAPPRHAPRQHTNLRKFAAKAISRQYREVIGAGRDVASLDAEGRHQLRIAAKKLRYAVEGFASLWPNKKVDPFLEVLSTLQDDLGRANDAAVAARLLEALGAPGKLAAFAHGWLGGETTVSMDPLAGHFKSLEDAPQFWKR